MNLEFATVDDMIAILLKAREAGYGNYLLVCNWEYFLAMKDEEPSIRHDRKEISFGGHL